MRALSVGEVEDVEPALAAGAGVAGSLEQESVASAMALAKRRHRDGTVVTSFARQYVRGADARRATVNLLAPA